MRVRLPEPVLSQTETKAEWRERLRDQGLGYKKRRGKLADKAAQFVSAAGGKISEPPRRSMNFEELLNLPAFRDEP